MNLPLRINHQNYLTAMLVLVFSAFGLLSSGCALFSGATKQEVNELVAKLESKESELRFLRDQNLVLRTRLAKEDARDSDLKAQNSEAGVSVLIHRSRKAFAEKSMGQLEELNEELVRRFPASPEVEESLYLLGKFYYEEGSWGRALGPLNQLIDIYPYSSRRASSLLLKAKAYKALNLLTIAEKIFEEIKNKYPGSPEYFKASYEMTAIASPSKM